MIRTTQTNSIGESFEKCRNAFTKCLHDSNRSDTRRTISEDSSGLSRRYQDHIDFKKPIVGPTGSKLVGYSWMNKNVETVDNRGEDRVLKISDWESALTNPVTNRNIVHHFHVIDDNGNAQTVSLETASRMLGISKSGVKTGVLKEIRQRKIEIDREEAARKDAEIRKSQEDEISQIITVAQKNTFENLFHGTNGIYDTVNIGDDGKISFFNSDGVHVDILKDGTTAMYTRADGFTKYALLGHDVYAQSVKDSHPQDK